MLRQPEYLPMSREEMNALGWNELDVLLISGDAYVDSHAFGAALLGRWLVAHGFRTGIVAQPGWESTDDLTRMGRPRLFAGVTAGALDSLVAHYTAFRKKRHDDAYTPGGREGARPNRAVLVYAGLARRAFPGLAVVAGGVEASLRRASHYDFWSDALRRSAVLDSKVDAILYGMAETSILELARLFAGSTDAGRVPADAIAKAALRGSAYAVHPDAAPDGVVLPSHEAIAADPKLLVKTALAFERQMLHGGPRLVQRSGSRAVVFEPPQAPLDRETMDAVYSLPFTRKAHPSYAEPVPAVEMLEASVVSHRGCGGGCSFCSLALHQGRTVQSRSAGSILAEIEKMAKTPEWKGSISDIGGPSANMWNARCEGSPADCQRESCLFPKRCRHFKAAQEEQIGLLRKVRDISGVGHVRVASGVRHDLALESEAYLAALAGEFTGGQLKIAPEHVTEKVLRLMRKPGGRGLRDFLKKFASLSREAGKEQYVIPYLMSAFPGCTDQDMRDLAAWLDRHGLKPKQVQCFIPTPGTVASAMFYAKVDTEDRPIFVARSDGERLFQHRILLPDAEPPPAKPGRPEFPAGRDGRRPERRTRPAGGGTGRGFIKAGSRPDWKRKPSDAKSDEARESSGDRPDWKRKPPGTNSDAKRKPFGGRPDWKRKPSDAKSDEARESSGDRPDWKRKPSGTNSDAKRKPFGGRPDWKGKPSGTGSNTRREPPGDRPDWKRKPPGATPDAKRKPSSDRPAWERKPPKTGRDGGKGRRDGGGRDGRR